MRSLRHEGGRSMTERRWASVMSAVVAVLIGTLTMAGCATDKGPAQAAIAAAETAVSSTLAEASKYLPDEVRSLQAGLTAAKEKFNKGDYAAATTEAKAVADKGGDLAEAIAKGSGVKAKAAEVMTTLGMPVPDALKG